MALNKDFNLNKLERYLILAKESNAKNIVVILTKADLCSDFIIKQAMVEAICFDINIHVVSCINNYGIDQLQQYFVKDEIVVALGSSGVGKSTLINTITNSTIMKVSTIRESDDQGRHTTTHRQLIKLENGSYYIDTPGMRELEIMEANNGISSQFNDIELLAKLCKFKDCTHQTEPGCNVKLAVKNNLLTEKRLKQYFKLKKEAAFQQRKTTLKNKKQ